MLNRLCVCVCVCVCAGACVYVCMYLCMCMRVHVGDTVDHASWVDVCSQEAVLVVVLSETNTLTNSYQ